jgi:hypothetical protein
MKTTQKLSILLLVLSLPLNAVTMTWTAGK